MVATILTDAALPYIWAPTPEFELGKHVAITWRDTPLDKIGSNITNVVWLGTGPTWELRQFCEDNGMHLLYLSSAEAGHVTATSEYALMLLIKAARALELEISESTVCILGSGRIATRVGKVLAFMGAHTCTIPIPGKSDIVFCSRIPAAYDPYLGYKDLSSTYNGMALVDTSAPGIIDTLGLIRAVDEGHIPFAAIDVHEGELSPFVRSVLMDYTEFHDNLLVSNHIAGSLEGARAKVQTLLLNNLKKELER